MSTTLPRSEQGLSAARTGSLPPPVNARKALERPRPAREKLIRLAVLLASLVLLVVGWRVTEIDFVKLASGLGGAQHIVRGLVTPHLFDPARTTDTYTVPLTIGQGAQDEVAGQEKNGRTLLVEPAAVQPGEYVYFSVRGFPPGSEGQLRLVGDGLDVKLYDVVVDAEGNLKTPQRTGPIDVYFPWPGNVATSGTYTATLTMGIPGNGWVPSDTLLLSLSKMWETILLALMGTVMGVVISVPLSFFGARNLMKGTLAGEIAYTLVRTFFNVGRSIEVLILAVIMAVVVGIGPFAGVMAIVLHSIGAMGKLYSEAIESIDPGPIEAVKATGATGFQTVLYAVVPQVVPAFLSFTMYRWDINVRMSTVIGLVGGGGIGYVLIQFINLGQWSQAATALWLIAIVVMSMDYASATIRERIV